MYIYVYIYVPVTVHIFFQKINHCGINFMHWCSVCISKDPPRNRNMGSAGEGAWTSCSKRIPNKIYSPNPNLSLCTDVGFSRPCVGRVPPRWRIVLPGFRPSYPVLQDFSAAMKVSTREDDRNVSRVKVVSRIFFVFLHIFEVLRNV